MMLAPSACGAPMVPVSEQSPPLAAVQEVVLVETDSLFVARPVRLSIHPDGRLFVADDASGSVFEYARDGTLRSRFGRLGAGPGEFRAPGVVAFLGDTAIAVEDRRLRRLKVLATRDGEEMAQVRFDGISASAATFWRDTVWFGVLAPYQDPTTLQFTGLGALARWVPGDSVAPILWEAPDGLIVGGAVSPLAILASQEIVPDSLGFWVKYGVRDVLERRSRDGVLLREWPIPRIVRRGVPHEEIERVGESRSRWMSLSPDYAERTFSQDLALGALAPGRLVLMTLDTALDDETTIGTLYLSFLDPLGERACVDRRVPYSGAGRPVVTFYADTVVVLSQEVEEHASEVRLVAKYYTPLGEDCLSELPMPAVP